MAKTPYVDLPNRVVILDGGMGRELNFRGVPISETIWSASALITAPEVVEQIHRDYIKAGADIITTNTYGLIRWDLAKENLGDRFIELNQQACYLAKAACKDSEHQVLIAGALPPLKGSFRPDLVGSPEELAPCYREQAELLAPHVDLLLCETMSSAVEGRASAEAACKTGKPVWVSWTLSDDFSGRLRSGETISQAMNALAGLPVSGFLVNCCSPRSVTAAIPQLASGTTHRVGGYANTFQPIPQNWRLDGDKETDGLLTLRNDLDPHNYAEHAAQWIKAGAGVIGGCCGTRPEHIAKIHELFSNPNK